MRILITGGAGFIGSHVCEKLISQGHKLIVVDNLSTGKKSNISDDILFFNIDIKRKSSLRTLLRYTKKIDAVIHLAAQTQVSKSITNPRIDAKDNVLSTLNILELMVEFDIKKIIFSSTAAVYGDQHSSHMPLKEDIRLEPRSPYAASKLSSEEYIKMYSRLHDIDYCIFRFSNVYGPRQDVNTGGVIAKFIFNLKECEQVKINGDGEQTRDFIYVKDVADGISYGLENLSGIFNLSTGEETSINEVLNTLSKFLSVNNVSHEKSLTGDIRRSCLSNKRIIKDGWKPNYNFVDSIKETFKYENGELYEKLS